MQAYAPASEQDAAATIAEAAARGERLRLVGGDTKAGIGRPAQDEATLSAAAIQGVTLYEPAEMVIAARAGTPLAEVQATLGQRGQMLPFEPMDHRALMGSQGEPTFGAVAAANNSGRLLNTTLNRHAEAAGIPSFSVEVRNDLIRDDAGVTAWCDRIARMIAHVRDSLALTAPSAT